MQRHFYLYFAASEKTNLVKVIKRLMQQTIITEYNHDKKTSDTLSDFILCHCDEYKSIGKEDRTSLVFTPESLLLNNAKGSYLQINILNATFSSKNYFGVFSWML